MYRSSSEDRQHTEEVYRLEARLGAECIERIVAVFQFHAMNESIGRRLGDVVPQFLCHPKEIEDAVVRPLDPSNSRSLQTDDVAAMDGHHVPDGAADERDSRPPPRHRRRGHRYILASDRTHGDVSSKQLVRMGNKCLL